MARELKILETNLKSEKNYIVLSRIFADFIASVIKTARLLIFFISRKGYLILEVLKHLFSESRNNKGVGC